MALSYVVKNIEVVVWADDCVKCTREEYNTYLKDLDETRLKLDGEPTRFVMSKTLPWEASRKMRNDLYKIEQKEGAQIDAANPMSGFNVQINTGSQAMDEVKAALIDVKSPDVVGALRYEADKAGVGASRALMEKLLAIGAVEDLHAARQGQINTKEIDQKK